MSNFKRSSVLTYSLFTALVLSASLAGCNGSSDGDDSKGGGSTTPGAGTGVGGAGHGPAPVNLGGAAPFAILTKSGVTDKPTSVITGDVGASGISGTAIGVTCAEVTGIIYSVDEAGPLPCRVTDATLLTAAVGNMETAYTDAAGRTLPDVTELNSGEIGGYTLAPGLYKWGTGVSISYDVTLSGGPNDVWIFQIADSLTMASAKKVTLAGGALAKNIFWQVAGATVTLGTTAHLEGTVLAKNLIAFESDASVNGRLLSQKAVTLIQNVVTRPAP